MSIRDFTVGQEVVLTYRRLGGNREQTARVTKVGRRYVTAVRSLEAYGRTFVEEYVFDADTRLEKGYTSYYQGSWRINTPAEIEAQRAAAVARATLAEACEARNIRVNWGSSLTNDQMHRIAEILQEEQ